MKPLKIGILGVSQLVYEAMIEPAIKIDGVEIISVASRDFEKAKNFAALYAIPHAIETFEKLLEDPKVDLVYIALPNSLHAHYSILALKAGKHVLVEKPAAPNLCEVQKMVSAQIKGVRLFEAFHYQFHPFWAFLTGLARPEKIGQIYSIDAKIRVPMNKTIHATRWRNDLGGGVLRDIGCYPIDWFLRLIGDFEILSKTIDYAPEGVDEACRAQIRFANNAKGNLDISMREDEKERYSQLILIGETGSICARNLVLPHFGSSIDWQIKGKKESKEFEGETTYYYQLKSLVEAIANQKIMPNENDAIINNSRHLAKFFD